MDEWGLDVLVAAGEDARSFFVSDSTGRNSVSCLS